MRSSSLPTLIVIAAAAGIGGCAPPVRTQPPAPIIEARRLPPPVPVEAPTAAPAPEPTRVYAYQPPSALQPKIPADSGFPAEAIERPGTQAQPGNEGMLPLPGAQADDSATPRDQVKPAQQPRQPIPQAEPATPDQPTTAPPAPETQVASAAQSLAPPDLPPAVDALVRQAEAQRQSRDYAGAAATLERALRLQSRDAYLWNRLAHVRLEQGLATQAANLAARANDLSGDQASLRRDNWLVIANAKRRAGDPAGAREAERKATGG